MDYIVCPIGITQNLPIIRYRYLPLSTLHLYYIVQYYANVPKNRALFFHPLRICNIYSYNVPVTTFYCIGQFFWNL